MPRSPTPSPSFVGLENFRAAFEMRHFLIALRNSVGFTVVAAVFKSLLGTSLAFLLLQPFKGKKFMRGLVVIPFTLPICISVLGWKWMYDSQFSVINWGLSRVGADRRLRVGDWPIWLGQPHLALLAVHRGQRVAATFRSRPSCCSRDSRRCPPKCLMPRGSTAPASSSASATSWSPMIFADPLHRLPVRHRVHAVRPERRVPPDPGRSGNATQILPVLAYQIGIQAGALAEARRSRCCCYRCSSPRCS